MKKFVEVVFGLFLLAVFSPILLVLLWDIVRITWASFPWWFQVVAIFTGVAMIAITVRKVIKKMKGGGSSGLPDIHIHNHYPPH